MSYTPYRLLQLFLEFYHVLICYQYITNPDKTNEKLLVSSIGCTEKNAPGVFQLALMGNSQKALDEQVIKAYHFIQSFAPTDEVTPEEAHQIGMDFMKKTFDDRYAFLCSTHVGKNHIHNHFVLNSFSFLDGRRYKGFTHRAAVVQ